MLTLPPEVVPGYTYVMESAVITDLLFRGLLTLDRDMNVVPSLAENMRVSSDGISYLFQLHDGLRWSDGEPLTTHDFAYTWERIRELELPTAFLLDDVSEVIAHDDRTLEVVLCRASQRVSVRAGALGAAAVAAARGGAPTAPNWRTEEMVTNGPFKVAEMDSHHLLAVADPNWLGPSGQRRRDRVRVRAARPASAGRRAASGSTASSTCSPAAAASRSPTISPTRPSRSRVPPP